MDIDVNSLKTNELTYELELRHIDNAAQLTVDEKRKILRGCFKQVSANRSFVEPSNRKPFRDDFKGATETFNDLSKIIDKFTDNISDKKKIEDRLTHLSNRVARFNTDNDVEQITEKQGLMAKILTLEGAFEFKLDTLEMNASTPTHTRQTVAIPQEIPVPSVQNRKSIPPFKWNISFTGSTHRESVISFLEKVEELRVSRNVSKEDLFLSACDIFKGPAWTWFLTHRHNFNNWDHVVQKLKADFLPYFYEQDLLSEIQNRTMGNNERVTLYIASMECLYKKLSVLPQEKVRVDQIRRNLLPFYINQLALTEIHTIEELSDYCKRLEESKSWSERYRTPPSKKFGLLEPDLSTFPSTSSYNNNTSNTSAVQNFKSLTCWNCDKVGHSYSVCRSQKKLFCYGCGRKGVIKAKCHNCSKNAVAGGVNRQIDVVTNSHINVSPSVSTEMVASTVDKGKAKGKSSKQSKQN